MSSMGQVISCRVGLLPYQLPGLWRFLIDAVPSGLWINPEEIKNEQTGHQHKSSKSRGRWDGAISPRTPGFMPPLESLPPIELPKVPGGGGIFKSAAVAVLREEKRLMSTGEIARSALKRGYIRCQGKTPEATMASALYTDVKKKGDNSLFTRPEEGLFGLREWLSPGDSPPAEAPLFSTCKFASLPTGPSKRPHEEGISVPPPRPSGKPPPRPATSAHSVDENLLLLLDAADELEAEGTPTKRRRSETGDSSQAKHWKKIATAKARQATTRAIPITRPKPLELPLPFAGWDKPITQLNFAGKMTTPVPNTPGMEEEPLTSPSQSQQGDSPVSHDSATSARHTAHMSSGAAEVARCADRVTQSKLARPGGDTDLCETTSSDSSLEDEAADKLMPASFSHMPKPILLPLTSLPQVGQMLAAGHFAARLIHANALVSQLESVFGKVHPLVGKAYLAKARICQLEGSRLSLMEAEQAILQAQRVLHPQSEAQAEAMYLLETIRQQAFVLSNSIGISAAF